MTVLVQGDEGEGSGCTRGSRCAPGVTPCINSISADREWIWTFEQA